MGGGGGDGRGPRKIGIQSMLLKDFPLMCTRKKKVYIPYVYIYVYKKKNNDTRARAMFDFFLHTRTRTRHFYSVS